MFGLYVDRVLCFCIMLYVAPYSNMLGLSVLPARFMWTITRCVFGVVTLRFDCVFLVFVFVQSIMLPLSVQVFRSCQRTHQRRPTYIARRVEPNGDHSGASRMADKSGGDALIQETDAPNCPP